MTTKNRYRRMKKPPNTAAAAPCVFWLVEPVFPANTPAATAITPKRRLNGMPRMTLSMSLATSRIQNPA